MKSPFLKFFILRAGKVQSRNIRVLFSKYIRKIFFGENIRNFFIFFFAGRRVGEGLGVKKFFNLRARKFHFLRYKEKVFFTKYKKFFQTGLIFRTCFFIFTFFIFFIFPMPFSRKHLIYLDEEERQIVSLE